MSLLLGKDLYFLNIAQKILGPELCLALSVFQVGRRIAEKRWHFFPGRMVKVPPNPDFYQTVMATCTLHSGCRHEHEEDGPSPISV